MIRSESFVVCALIRVVDVWSNFGELIISVCDAGLEDVVEVVSTGADNDDSNWVRRSIVEVTVRRNISIICSSDFEDVAMVVA